MKLIVSVHNPNRGITKDDKSGTNRCYVRCTTLKARVRGMPTPQTGVTHYHEQLVLPDKNRAIIGLVFCYVVWLVSMKGRTWERYISPLLWSG